MAIYILKYPVGYLCGPIKILVGLPVERLIQVLIKIPVHFEKCKLKKEWDKVD